MGRAVDALVTERSLDVRRRGRHLSLGEGEVSAAPHTHDGHGDRRQLDGWADERARVGVGAVPTEARREGARLGECGEDLRAVVRKRMDAMKAEKK